MLGDDRRLADAGVSLDEQRPLATGRRTPRIQLVEQPLPATEVRSLGMQERREVERIQLMMPRAIPLLTAQRRVNAVDQPLQAGAVLLVRVLPRSQVDVVEMKDRQRRFARLRHDRHDRLRRRLKQGVSDLAQADAINLIGSIRIARRAHRMWRQHGHHDLRRSQAIHDFGLPILSRTNLSRVPPHVEPGRRQIDTQPIHERRGIAPAVAQKHTRLRGRCRCAGLPSGPPRGLPRIAGALEGWC